MSGIYPGSVNPLRDLDTLREAEEWTALAALAYVARQEGAVGALAAAADREAAFRWAWSLVLNADEAGWWLQFANNLAEGMRVPDNWR